MNRFEPRGRSAFSPTLLSSESLKVSDEQKMYIREVLSVASSDEQFATKAYNAIQFILTSGSVKIPTVTSLTPSTAEIGDANPTLHVHGTNFTSGSIIVFNGGEEATVYVSATEVTTVVNMATVSMPIAVPVAVLSTDGVLSNPMSFTFTDGTPLAASAEKTAKDHKDLPHASIPHAEKK